MFIECEGGRYGQDCALLCGHCVNNEQCHHFDGRCLNGCQPGFQGDNCTQGNKQSPCVHFFLFFKIDLKNLIIKQSVFVLI